MWAIWELIYDKTYIRLFEKGYFDYVIFFLFCLVVAVVVAVVYCSLFLSFEQNSFH